MFDCQRLLGPCKLVRVLTCVVPPFDPGEVHELAVTDMAVGRAGVMPGPLRVRRFDLGGVRSHRSRSVRVSRHLMDAVWSGEMPEALAAHDASTVSLVFNPQLTGPLPWISLHKVARRVWPGQPSYELEPLSRWRGWAGRHGPFNTPLPDGAEREAELTAGLLRELFQDPGLPDAGEAAWLDTAGRLRTARSPRADLDVRDPFKAALLVSGMPSRPLLDPPSRFDDDRDWAGVGVDDLCHWIRFGPDRDTARAARAELRRRDGTLPKKVDIRSDDARPNQR